jgi:hypothetical protein
VGGKVKQFILLLLCISLLSAGVEDQSTRFVVLGDRTSNSIEGVFSDIIDEVSLLHPDFVISVGNLIEGRSNDSAMIIQQWADVLNIIEVLPCDFYFVPGSNDVYNEVSRTIYENVTGVEGCYSFDRGNSHFIVLDNSTIGWAPLPDADPEQFAWLLQDLEDHRDASHIFVFLHVPAYLNALTADTPSPLMEAFRIYRVRAVFSGSLHSYMYLNEDGTDYIVMGSSGAETEDLDPAKGNFYHYLFVTLTGEEYDAAVIRKGNISLRNVVTGSDYVSIQRAQSEVVSFPELFWKEDSADHSITCKIQINNTGTDSMNTPLVWHFDTLRYLIVPREIPVVLAPEESMEHEFQLKTHGHSSIFPLPYFALVFPFTYGKVCTLKGSMGVRRIKSVKEFISRPVIDGVLEDDVWSSTKPITELAGAGGEESSIEKCEIYLGHDRENLFIGARCFESDLNALRIQAAEHDGPVYGDDNLWFFFDTNLDEETYYQLMINPNAVVFDRLCSIQEGAPQTELGWNAPWEVSAGREQNAWTIEMRIPKHALEPFDEKKWGFNFRRLQTRLAEAGCWSLPFGHDPGSFGIIEFE